LWLVAFFFSQVYLIFLVDLDIIHILYYLSVDSNRFNVLVHYYHTAHFASKLVLAHNPIACIALRLVACHPNGIGYRLENDIFGFAFLSIGDAFKVRYFDFVPFVDDAGAIYYRCFVFA
jgi:hypothetical protein